MSFTPLIIVNGEQTSSVSVLDRGFAYGDGLFETCRYFNGRIPLWTFHLERLLTSANRLGFAIDTTTLNQYLTSLLEQLTIAKISSAVVKVIITRGLGGRGYKVPDCISPTYCLSVFPVGELRSKEYVNGINVRVCKLKLARSKALAGIKHLNRLEQILARMEWHDEVDEGLLLDEQENLIEAISANLFLVKNNTLITPDLSYAGVAGVMRQVIIQKIAPQLNIPVLIQDVKLAALSTADEVFLCNSVRGLKPVNQIASIDKTITINDFSNLPKTITQQLQRGLEQEFFSELDSEML